MEGDHVNTHLPCPDAIEGTMFEDANDIYKKFIDPHCTDCSAPVNLSSKQRHDIKVKIESGDVQLDIFDASQKEIFSIMCRDSYPRFLNSKKNRKPI